MRPMAPASLSVSTSLGSAPLTGTMLKLRAVSISCSLHPSKLVQQHQSLVRCCNSRRGATWASAPSPCSPANFANRTCYMPAHSDGHCWPLLPSLRSAFVRGQPPENVILQSCTKQGLGTASDQWHHQGPGKYKGYAWAWENSSWGELSTLR